MLLRAVGLCGKQCLAGARPGEPDAGHAAAGEGCASINRVADLRARMQTRRADAAACVRLLNATGVIGCARDLAQGPLRLWPDAQLDDRPHSPDGAPRRAPSYNALPTLRQGVCTLASLLAARACAVPVPAGQRVVLVPEAQLGALLARLRADSPFAARVAGVLVLPGARPTDPAETPGPRPTASLAARFPLAELAPYAPGAWAWNPGGAGLLRAPLPAPVALLDDGAAADARRRAAANARQARGAKHCCIMLLAVGRTSQPGIHLALYVLISTANACSVLPSCAMCAAAPAGVLATRGSAHAEGNGRAAHGGAARADGGGRQLEPVHRGARVPAAGRAQCVGRAAAAAGGCGCGRAPAAPGPGRRRRRWPLP